MLAFVLAAAPLVATQSSSPAFISAAVAPDSAEIALGDSFGRVWIVDLVCEEATLAFETKVPISALQWSRDGRRLIAGQRREPNPGDFDRGLQFASTLALWNVWDRDRGVLGQVRERMPARSIAWSVTSDLGLMFAYGSNAVARVRDVNSGEVVSEVKCGSGARFTCSTWLADDLTVVAGASDGLLYTWSRHARTRSIDLGSTIRFPCAIDAAKDAAHVLVGFQEREGTRSGPNGVWPVRAAWVNLDTGAVVQTFDAVTGCVGMSTDDGVWDVDIDPLDERCVITTGSWGSVSCCRIADGAVLWREDLGGGNPVRLRAHFSPSGSRIATHGMRMREPTIHEATSGERIVGPYGQFGWETRDGVLWTHDERYLITPDHDLRVADGKTGERRFDLRCGTTGAVVVR